MSTIVNKLRQEFRPSTSKFLLRFLSGSVLTTSSRCRGLGRWRVARGRHRSTRAGATRVERLRLRSIVGMR